MNSKKIPVILDTDIGGDIDDTWALALLLNSPELDTKLIVTDTADTGYRAKIVAKLLEIAGRTDIPIGIGHVYDSDGPREKQLPWVKDYNLSKYKGKVFEDGVQALIDTIMQSPEPVNLIGISPAANIKEALEREPLIARKAHFVGMFGCFGKSHDGKEETIAEFNVEKNITAAQAVFSAPWMSMTITPLDTCGIVRLKEKKYQQIVNCTNPLTRAIIENYRIWLKGRPDEMSSILYDTVAVYLAFSTGLLEMKKMNISVDNKGYTVENPKARVVNCALNWKNLGAFEDLLVKRLTATAKG
ncbi:MAG: hypothetical protein A2252_05340 [Elusimicrobia bacterium RIFOXYA2_FULL_39_19]|nr:MAG: hypothetical protein A2252_05340 [Elusimicrobia bacterium RIFOXYA2_FULL_39_19]